MRAGCSKSVRPSITKNSSDKAGPLTSSSNAFDKDNCCSMQGKEVDLSGIEDEAPLIKEQQHRRCCVTCVHSSTKNLSQCTFPKVRSHFSVWVCRTTKRKTQTHREIWKCQLQARNPFHIVPGLEDWKQKHGKVELLQTTYLRAQRERERERERVL